MSRNTVAGGIPPDFGPSANLSPFAADSAAAFSRAAFSPSFLTSLAVSLPASGGAGGGMTLADGAGERTFVSGALAASEVFGASATFTGSGAPLRPVPRPPRPPPLAPPRPALPPSHP